MDKLLADMIAKRDLQLSNATAKQDANAAQEWITKDNNNPDSFTNTITNPVTPTLKIGESLDVTNIENIKIDVRDEVSEHRKRVTFAETESTTTNDFSKVKKTKRCKGNNKRYTEDKRKINNNYLKLTTF